VEFLDPDGNFLIIATDGDEVIYATFTLAGKWHGTDTVLQAVIPFHVFMTGNLAYYSICYGKENVISH
jgi:hypothetical protein